MEDHAEQQHADEGQTQAPAVYYGTARMQQMSGGMTSEAPPTAVDEDSAYGAARIAQLHGIGSDLATGEETRNNDDEG